MDYKPYIDKQYEIYLISSLLRRSAGFGISCGIRLSLNSDGPNKWEVEWEEYYNPHDNHCKSEIEILHFTNPYKAAECFIELRHIAQIGEDYNYEPGGYYMLGSDLEAFREKYKEK